MLKGILLTSQSLLKESPSNPFIVLLELFRSSGSWIMATDSQPAEDKHLLSSFLSFARPFPPINPHPPTFLVYDLVPREFLTQNPTEVTGNISINRSTQGRENEQQIEKEKIKGVGEVMKRFFWCYNETFQSDMFLAIDNNYFAIVLSGRACYFYFV